MKSLADIEMELHYLYLRLPEKTADKAFNLLKPLLKEVRHLREEVETVTSAYLHERDENQRYIKEIELLKKKIPKGKLTYDYDFNLL